MNLILVSLLVLLATLASQQVPGGNLFDIVTPLLVSVGLVATRKTAVIWTLCMAFFWSALTRSSFVMIAVLWGLAMWAMRVVSREIEWRKPGRIFFIAMIVSFGWRVCLLLLVWFNGSVPTMDTVAILSLLIRPITSGMIAAVFSVLLLWSANPSHPSLR